MSDEFQMTIRGIKPMKRASGAAKGKDGLFKEITPGGRRGWDGWHGALGLGMGFFVVAGWADSILTHTAS